MTGYSELAGEWEGAVRGMLAGSPRPELGVGRLWVLGEGMDSVAVGVVNGAGEYVVRLPKGADGAESIAREARLLPELGARVRVPIPRFLFTAANPLGPGECCVYPAVPGESLSAREWRERGLFTAGVAGAVAEFLTAVHAFPVERARELGVQDRDMRVEYADDLELVRAQVVPLLPVRCGKRLVELWEEYLTTDGNFEYAPTLLHADVSVDHLLVSDGRLSGVIDFGDVEIGDPDYDLSYLWAEAGPEFVARVQDGAGLPVDERLVAKLNFWACAENALDVLHALENEMSEFRETALHRLREALETFGDQTGSL